MKAAVISEKGRRQEMEDAHFLDLDFGGKGWVYAGIYDGHGGKLAAEHAARKLHAAFLASMLNGSSPQESFTRCYEAISQEVADQPSGATAVDLFIDSGVVYSANAGDARAIIVGSKEVHQLTIDHRLNDPSERQRIEKMGGIIDYPYTRRGPFGIMPTRTIGDSYFKPVGIIATPSVGQYDISPTDMTVIAACDGLWDVMDNNAVAEFARSYPVPDDLVEQLKQEALVNRVGSDNLTILALALRDTMGSRKPRRSLITRVTKREPRNPSGSA